MNAGHYLIRLIASPFSAGIGCGLSLGWIHSVEETIERNVRLCSNVLTLASRNRATWLDSFGGRNNRAKCSAMFKRAHVVVKK